MERCDGSELSEAEEGRSKRAQINIAPNLSIVEGSSVKWNASASWDAETLR